MQFEPSEPACFWNGEPVRQAAASEIPCCGTMVYEVEGGGPAVTDAEEDWESCGRGPGIAFDCRVLDVDDAVLGSVRVASRKLAALNASSVLGCASDIHALLIHRTS